MTLTPLPSAPMPAAVPRSTAASDAAANGPPSGFAGLLHGELATHTACTAAAGPEGEGPGGEGSGDADLATLLALLAGSRPGPAGGEGAGGDDLADLAEALAELAELADTVDDEDAAALLADRTGRPEILAGLADALDADGPVLDAAPAPGADAPSGPAGGEGDAEADRAAIMAALGRVAAHQQVAGGIDDGSGADADGGDTVGRITIAAGASGPATSGGATRAGTVDVATATTAGADTDASLETTTGATGDDAVVDGDEAAARTVATDTGGRTRGDLAEARTPASPAVAAPEAGARSADLRRPGGTLPSPTVARVLDALDRLENAPPPRVVIVESGDARLRVGLEAGVVRLSLLGPRNEVNDAVLRETAQALEARGVEADVEGDPSRHHGSDRPPHDGPRDGLAWHLGRLRAPAPTRTSADPTARHRSGVQL